MSKLHMLTREHCLVCDTQVKDHVFLHKTRRQSHVLCTDCFKGYVEPIIKKNTELLRQNFKEEIDVILCTGSYHGQGRNMCKSKVKLEEIVSNNQLLFLGDTLITDIFRIIYATKDPLKFCCPKEECGNLIQLEANNWNSLVQCNDCDTTVCRWCKTIPYHTDMNCIEYSYSKSADENTREIMLLKDKGELKFCKVCSAPITRLKDKNGQNEGCNKVICTICGVKSCWLCSATHIDYDHFNETTGACPGKLFQK